VKGLLWLRTFAALALIVVAAASSLACKRGTPEPRTGAPAASPAARSVSFPTDDGGFVDADEYGAGARGVVLAHGARFDKESWSQQARALAEKGFRVLAIDFRGYGRSRAGSASFLPGDGLSLDVLAAVRYLRASGTERVSIVGGSMGGGAAAQASVECRPTEIDAVVLLAPAAIAHPERMQGRKLFVVGRDDADANGARRLETIREQFDKAPDPKELMILRARAVPLRDGSGTAVDVGDPEVLGGWSLNGARENARRAPSRCD
jgi:pimeloyl-ACP methyl ester carboxylesterase